MAVSLREHGYYAASVGATRPRAFENAFVDGVYTALAPVYDLLFGAPLQRGRRAAIAALGIGHGDRVLEVGTGTALTAPLYPHDCRVTAVDLSPSMLQRARARVLRDGLTHVRLLAVDAARLTFADCSFDGVCAPYVISVVPDPVAVLREMRRVCRAGGRIVLLNHFQSPNRLLASVERAVSPVMLHAGFRSDLNLPALLAAAGLRPVRIQKVNWPPIWSLVACIRD
jgi:phosphatidylethanolamine/phosphatidyl-N-methylethanolamine N-methyltransferase